MKVKLISARDVAEWLDLDIQRIYELTRDGHIPFVRIGDRQYRYSITAIQRWIEAGGSQGGGDSDERA